MRPLKLKALWHTIGWLYLGFVIYSSLTPSLPDLPSFPGADKILHVTAYAIMMLWFGFLYQSRRSLVIWGALFITLGIALDLLQGTTSYRSMEVLDMIANAFGVLLGGMLASTGLGEMLAAFERLMYRQESRP
jgi:VanZ family protein